MRFDLTKFPLNELDEQVKDEKGKLGTYREAFMRAAANDFTGERDQMGNSIPVRGEEKFKRFDMWQKVKHSNGRIDLDAREVIYLTELCRDAFPVLVAGQCRDFLKRPEPDAPTPG